jgi:hypothetical protein
MRKLPPISREELAAAISDTAQRQMDWANSKENNGPFSEEAYGTSVHLSGALRALAYAILHPGVVGR